MDQQENRPELPEECAADLQMPELLPDEPSVMQTENAAPDEETSYTESETRSATEQQPEHTKVRGYRGKYGRKTEEPVSLQVAILLYLRDLVKLLALIVVIFALFFRIVVVSGTSMNDTLLDGDYLLLLGDVLYRDPKQGDIIVASKSSFDNGNPIIKRVIATEGQWVDIDFLNGIVYVGDSLDTLVALDEPYIKNLTTRNEGMVFPLQVEAGHVFVLGDNRDNSMDSRDPDVGLIDEREILGKAIFLFLPGTNYGAEQFDIGRIGVVD